MQKPFEEATFALRVWEVSDIVDTQSEVHFALVHPTLRTG
jgi:hypothetical protein